MTCVDAGMYSAVACWYGRGKLSYQWS